MQTLALMYDRLALEDALLRPLSDHTLHGRHSFREDSFIRIQFFDFLDLPVLH